MQNFSKLTTMREAIPTHVPSGATVLLGVCRVEALGVKRHAYSAPFDFGY